MKKKKMFKNNIQMIIYFLLYSLCIVAFIFIGKANYNKEDQPEALKFSSLYNLVDDNNNFVFINANKALEIVSGKSGIILFGFPKNKWTNYYASILNDVCMNNNIDKVYYYDFLNDRTDKNGTYETIVNRLEAYAPVNDKGVQNISAPTVLIVKDGRVIAYFDDTSIIHGKISPDIYYTESQKSITHELFNTAVLEYIK